MSEDTERGQRPSFGAWLLEQAGREDWVGQLAAAGKSDRFFPRQGAPEDVRAFLRKQQADGDVFQAVDDAEMDWMSVDTSDEP